MSASISIQSMIGLLDLTRLEKPDQPAAIRELCQKALTTYGTVAAICVYPEFVSVVKDCLPDPAIKIASVANFPNGEDSLADTVARIETALKDGANEIDVVMPYKAYLAGDHQQAATLIQTCKAACGKARLKVILETGALQNPDLIYQASLLAIHAGADFIKTSTGKNDYPGATPEAAKMMLRAIHKTGGHCGFKASGGVRTLEQAQIYYALAAETLGLAWATPQHFRIGASSLLDELIKQAELI